MSKNLTNEEKLDAIYEMTRQNYEVLKTIRRQQYRALLIRLLYWLIIIGILGGAYHYIQPVVDAVSANPEMYQQKLTQLEQIKNQLPEANLYNKFMYFIKNLFGNGE